MKLNFSFSIFFFSVYFLSTQVISAQNWLIFTSQNSGLPSNYINCIKPTSQNKTWIGTDNGAAVYDWNNWQVYDSTNSSMKYNFILDIEEDVLGNIWIGSTSKLFFGPDSIGGLAHYDGVTWQIYNPSSSGLAGTYNSILAAAPDSSIWISTWPWTLSGYGITQNFDGTNWNTIFPPISDFVPIEFLVDQENIFWVGASDKGLGRYDGNTLTFYGPLNRFLSDFTIDPSGNKWAAVNCCPNKEIIKFDGVSFTSYQPPIILTPSEALTSIVADQLGNIWVGSNAGLLKFDGQNWQVIDTSNSLLPDNFTDHLEVDMFNNIWMHSGGTLTIYNENGIVTPVELASFTAEILSGFVILNWTTSSETNNKGFYVERNNDNEWENIGFVPGSGTSIDINNYSFKDEITGNGIIQFRLRQIDYDGSFSYSQILNVDVITPYEFYLSQNYPNPFNPVTIISFTLPVPVHVTLIIFDVPGNEISTLVNGFYKEGKHEIQFDASALSSGIYFYQIKAGNFIDTKKMIVLR